MPESMFSDLLNSDLLNRAIREIDCYYIAESQIADPLAERMKEERDPTP